MNSLSRLLRPALLLVVLALALGAVVQAAGSATIRDDAGLFTAAGRSAIDGGDWGGNGGGDGGGWT